MRNAEFIVHPDVIVKFVEELASHDLNNNITGTTEEGEIIINVDYDKMESDIVDGLEEFLDNLTAQIQNDEEDDDDIDE